jgi:hypothetical protein
MQDGIDFYTSINGKKYAKEFLGDIKIAHEDLWVLLRACLEHIRCRQNRKLPFSFLLGGGLFEARAKSKRLQGRINYCYDEDGIKLLNGYIKADRGSMIQGIKFGRGLLKEKIERSKHAKK